MSRGESDSPEITGNGLSRGSDSEDRIEFESHALRFEKVLIIHYLTRRSARRGS